MMELKVSEYKRFEDIKHVRDDGTEYWSILNGRSFIK
jgi:DNA-damage-inducible protein D